MDEPLGALDLKLREVMQVELRRIQRELGITAVYVTHDQSEAMNMSDRIAVMNHGLLEQVGTAEEIYNHPQSKFVASFVGQINFLDSTIVERRDSDALVEVCGTRFVAADSQSFAVGERVTVAIRPEHVTIRAASARINDANRLEGCIETISYTGNLVRTTIRAQDGTRLMGECRPDEIISGVGDAVVATWETNNSLLLRK